MDSAIPLPVPAAAQSAIEKTAFRDTITAAIDESPTSSITNEAIIRNHLSALDPAQRDNVLAGYISQRPKLAAIQKEAKNRARNQTRARRAAQHLATLDERWGSRAAWAPAAHFPSGGEGMGINMLSDFNTITRCALQNGVQLQSLWAPGGELHEAVHDGMTKAKIRSARNAILARFTRPLGSAIPSSDPLTTPSRAPPPITSSPPAPMSRHSSFNDDDEESPEIPRRTIETRRDVDVSTFVIDSDGFGDNVGDLAPLHDCDFSPASARRQDNIPSSIVRLTAVDRLVDYSSSSVVCSPGCNSSANCNNGEIEDDNNDDDNDNINDHDDDEREDEDSEVDSIPPLGPASEIHRAVDTWLNAHAITPDNKAITDIRTQIRGSQAVLETIKNAPAFAARWAEATAYLGSSNTAYSAVNSVLANALPQMPSEAEEKAKMAGLRRELALLEREKRKAEANENLARAIRDHQRYWGPEG